MLGQSEMPIAPPGPQRTISYTMGSRPSGVPDAPPYFRSVDVSNGLGCGLPPAPAYHNYSGQTMNYGDSQARASQDPSGRQMASNLLPGGLYRSADMSWARYSAAGLPYSSTRPPNGYLQQAGGPSAGTPAGSYPNYVTQGHTPGPNSGVPPVTGAGPVGIVNGSASNVQSSAGHGSNPAVQMNGQHPQTRPMGQEAGYIGSYQTGQGMAYERARTMHYPGTANGMYPTTPSGHDELYAGQVGSGGPIRMRRGGPMTASHPYAQAPGKMHGVRQASSSMQPYPQTGVHTQQQPQHPVSQSGPVNCVPPGGPTINGHVAMPTPGMTNLPPGQTMTEPSHPRYGSMQLPGERASPMAPHPGSYPHQMASHLAQQTAAVPKGHPMTPYPTQIPQAAHPGLGHPCDYPHMQQQAPPQYQHQIRPMGRPMPTQEMPPQYPERLTLAIANGNLWGPVRLNHEITVSHFEFEIRDDHLSRIQSRSDLEVVFTSYHASDQFRMCHWPERFTVCINGQVMTLDRSEVAGKRAHQPVNIKRFCRVGRNSIQITVEQCACSHLFAIYMVHMPDLKVVLQGLLRKRVLPREMTLRMLPGGQGQEVSLVCPVTRERLRIPARSQDCVHLQCFELEHYLRIQARWPQFTCPICGIVEGQLEKLTIDDLLSSILRQADPSVTRVLIHPNGGWQPLAPSNQPLPASLHPQMPQQQAQQQMTLQTQGHPPGGISQPCSWQQTTSNAIQARPPSYPLAPPQPTRPQGSPSRGQSLGRVNSCPSGSQERNTPINSPAWPKTPAGGALPAQQGTSPAAGGPSPSRGQARRAGHTPDSGISTGSSGQAQAGTPGHAGNNGPTVNDDETRKTAPPTPDHHPSSARSQAATVSPSNHQDLLAQSPSNRAVTRAPTTDRPIASTRDVNQSGDNLADLDLDLDFFGMELSDQEITDILQGYDPGRTVVPDLM